MSCRCRCARCGCYKKDGYFACNSKRCFPQRKEYESVVSKRRIRFCFKKQCFGDVYIFDKKIAEDVKIDMREFVFATKKYDDCYKVVSSMLYDYDGNNIATVAGNMDVNTHHTLFKDASGKEVAYIHKAKKMLYLEERNLFNHCFIFKGKNQKAIVCHENGELYFVPAHWKIRFFANGIVAVRDAGDLQYCYCNLKKPERVLEKWNNKELASLLCYKEDKNYWYFPKMFTKGLVSPYKFFKYAFNKMYSFELEKSTIEFCGKGFNVATKTWFLNHNEKHNFLAKIPKKYAIVVPTDLLKVRSSHGYITKEKFEKWE